MTPTSDGPERGRGAVAGVEYDEAYFLHSCGVPYRRDSHWLGFFGRIAERIVADLAPRSVLDAGCAMGFLVEALRDRGVDAYGLDISTYALSQVREDVRPYCWQASVTDPLTRRFDLIVCIEVLEHLPADSTMEALDNLCDHTDELLFSSTPEDLGEATHVNVRPTSYWVAELARRGLVADAAYDASYVLPWTRRLRRDLPSWQSCGGYEDRLASLAAADGVVREQLAQQREAVDALTQQLEANAREAEAVAAAAAATRTAAEARAAEAEAALAKLSNTREVRYGRRIRGLVAGRRRTQTVPTSDQTQDSAETDPLAEEFARRGPWVTRYVVGGRAYGGRMSFADDPRIEQFAERFGSSRTVLELGSLEGGHTFALTSRGFTVTAVEGRTDNVDRARFAQGLLGHDSVDFVLADLERTPLAQFGRFDVVFCCGLLYHLPRPWELLDQLATVADGTFLWTHYASEPTAEVDGIPGTWYDEFGLADSLSGLSPRSFWMTLPALTERIVGQGFGEIEVIEDDATHPHGPAVTLAARRTGS